MKIKVSILFLFVWSLNIMAQETFPESWVGNYKGELHIYGVDSVRMKVNMQLEIAKKTDSSYQWKTTYEYQGKKDERNYELLVVDKLKGSYKIDEKNSIVLDAYLRNGVFTSFFEVMDSYIITTHTKKPTAIVFEIISASGKNPSITGNAIFNDEQLPEVKSYLVNGRQKALLKKQ